MSPACGPALLYSGVHKLSALPQERGALMSTAPRTLGRKACALLCVCALALAAAFAAAVLPAKAWAGDGATMGSDFSFSGDATSAKQTFTLDITTSNTQYTLNLKPASEKATYHVSATVAGSAAYSIRKDTTVAIPFLQLSDASYNNKSDAVDLWDRQYGPDAVSKTVQADATGSYVLSLYVNDSASSVTVGSFTVSITITNYNANESSGGGSDPLPEISDFYDYNYGLQTQTSNFHTISATYSGYFMGSASADYIELQLDGKKAASYTEGSDGRYNISYTNSAVQPGHTYTVSAVAKKAGYADKVLATDTVTTPIFGKANVSATKLSSKKAFVSISVPYGLAASGVKLKLYKGSALVKTFACSNGKYTYTATVSKKGAGTAKYKVVASYSASGISATSTSAKAKPKANVYKGSKVRSITSYSKYTGYFVLTKVAYSGAKKLKVTGYFINRHIYTAKLKTTVGVYSNGKKVGSKTISSGKMSMNTKKKVTFTIKAKRLAAISNGIGTVSLSTWRTWP